MHFIFTVCDNAAGEICPIWPGHPTTAHWGLPDPASVVGSDAEVAAAFLKTYHALNRRIGAFVNLPIESLGKVALVASMTSIHEGNP
jgi:arsenate reductase